MAGARNKLSAKAVASAKSKPGKKSYRLSDGAGLYLHIRHNGSKNWEFRYKRPSTNKLTFTGLGAYPELSLALARVKADEYRRSLLNNIDPVLINEQDKINDKIRQISFSEVAKQWRNSKLNHLKEKTIHDNWRKLELHALPHLKNIPVEMLTAPIAIKSLRGLEQRGKLETVKRTAQLMNEVMNFAVNSGYINANPLSGIKDVFQKPQLVHMKALAPEEIYELLKAVATANIQVTTRCLIEWQLHTMARPNEAAGAQWNEIDLEKQLWIIPETRMKMKRKHEIPLTPQTVQILAAIKPISGHRTFIFPSSRNPKKQTDAETINKALARMGFKDRTTAHGLRSLASTTLNEHGFDADIIEAALAHKDNNKIRSAYNRTTYLDRRRTMMTWWSQYIADASFGSFSVSWEDKCANT